MRYPILSAHRSCGPWPRSYLSLSAYPVNYCDAPHRRADFESVKLGWLLAHCLDGPMLVYRDEDLPRVHELRDLLTAAQARVWVAKKSLGEPHSRDKARGDYSVAIKKLKRLNQELVRLAMGYSWPGATDPVSGAACCFLFDGDPYEPGTEAHRRMFAPPAVR